MSTCGICVTLINRNKSKALDTDNFCIIGIFTKEKSALLSSSDVLLLQYTATSIRCSE